MPAITLAGYGRRRVCDPTAVSSAATTLCLYVMLRLGSEWEGIPLLELMIKLGGTALLGLVVAPLVWQTAGALERQVGTYHTERL